MVERLTQTKQLRLINGETAEISLYTTIGFRQAQQIRNKFFDGLNVSPNSAKDGEIEFPMNRTFALAGDLIDAHWADKKYKPEDVEDEDLSAVGMELMSSFLQRSGIRAEIGDNQSS